MLRGLLFAGAASASIRFLRATSSAAFLFGGLSVTSFVDGFFRGGAGFRFDDGGSG